MKVNVSPSSIEDYRMFLRVKGLPRFSVVGRTIEFPDEYAGDLGLRLKRSRGREFSPRSGLFDYQAAVTKLAIEKRKFAVFMECGLGKTLVLTEFARNAASHLPKHRAVLIVSPLMVVRQTLAEVKRFYGDDLPIAHVKSSDLGRWLDSGTEQIGITNYEALTDDLKPGRLGAMILDESSLLKSHYGKWGTTAIRLGRGLDWKLALTGTPAPNDRIEYANHAVFLDQFPTVNSFLARFFINRGQTCERWELKPHALKPFYRALSHWSIFLTNPATYGWKDNCQTIPPIHVHIHNVPLTKQQREMMGNATGRLFAGELGGIMSRSTMGQIAKGNHRGTEIETNKPAFIHDLIESWPDESTLVWCLYNAEQDRIAEVLPGCQSMTGDTPEDQRERMIEGFKSGAVRVLVSKPKILGFGLNLQKATRQVFSGLQDSYEQFHQAVKRSNRVGSTRPLNVHIPATEIEMPMIDTVLRKAKRIDEETAEQEAIFKDAARLG
jgi:superfamily II DNA or RNA helicase